MHGEEEVVEAPAAKVAFELKILIGVSIIVAGTLLRSLGGLVFDGDRGWYVVGGASLGVEVVALLRFWYAGLKPIFHHLS